MSLVGASSLSFNSIPDILSLPYLSGYELFPGVGYYKFHPEGAFSFHEAMLICRKEGGHLAIPNSQQEMNVLNQIYGRYNKIYHYAFLGIHDMNEEGKYTTIFGQRLEDTGFSKWEKGEPNQGFGNEDCELRIAKYAPSFSQIAMALLNDLEPNG
ncbi:hypothetical protein J437_LFUL016948 [Ladona fulva]|uniref:C-type lectin domain-containing protein n=1 Tax=Ladona fulva TaxID=123851 RepID=A0A8K0KJV5_LADFU|nr:hypothetical protein J437_LFUL016948 [Ladona fulva]